MSPSPSHGISCNCREIYFFTWFSFLRLSVLSKKWQLKNNTYLISSGGLSLAKTGDHGFRVSSDKFQDTVNIVLHWQDKFLSLLVVKTFAQSWKNTPFCNKCFIFCSSFFQALSVSPQTVTFLFRLFSVLMDEFKSITHLQETSSPGTVNTHSLPPFCRTIMQSIFFHTASPEPTVFSHTEMTLFQCNICHLVRPVFITFPVSPVGKGHLSSPDTGARLTKLSWYSRTFFPVLCFSRSGNKVLWKVTDGQLLFMSTGQFVSFLEVSAWPSLDTCSAPGTNINQSFKAGKVTVELSGDGCNKKGWLTFKGTRKKTREERHNFLDDSWMKSWQDEWGTVWLCLSCDAEAKDHQFRHKTRRVWASSFKDSREKPSTDPTTDVKWKED